MRSPISTWIVDVAGWRDRWFDARLNRMVASPTPQTVIIECKQSRGDLLRDNRRLDALLRLRERYLGIRSSIEEHRIKPLEPHLRMSASSLFADMESWDFASSRSPAYRRTLERLERLDERLHGQTKFFRIARYALADSLYLATPRGLISQREVPEGWGLLECDPRALSDTGAAEPEAACMVERVAAPQRPARTHHRQRLLRNIAVAACAAVARASTRLSSATPASDAITHPLTATNC